jgi:hypothetical protein
MEPIDATMLTTQWRRLVKSLSSINIKWVVLSILAIPQIICLIIFWPGFLQLDYMIAIINVHQGSLGQWHSLIWGIIAEAVIYNTGTIWVYGILQVSFQVFIEWIALIKLRSINVVHNKWMIILSLIYGLTPCYLMYGLLWGGDVPFAILMMLLMVMMIEITHDKSLITNRKWLIELSTTIFFLVQLRKNALFIVPIVFITLLIYCRSVRKKKLIASMLATISLIIGVQIAFTAFGVEPSPLQEAVSIPAQQVGAVAHYEGNVSNKSNKVFEQVRTWKQWSTRYNAHNADSERLGITSDNFNGFLVEWVKTGLKNPGIYLKAYANLEYPYWRLSANYLDDYGSDFVDFDFNDFLYGPDCKGKVLIPQCKMNNAHIVKKNTTAQNWLNRLYGNIVYNNVPIISDLFSLIFFNAAAPFWTIILTFFITKRKKEWLIIMLPFAYIVLSLLAFSAVADPRYSMQLFWAIPIVWTCAIKSRISAKGGRPKNG